MYILIFQSILEQICSGKRPPGTMCGTWTDVLCFYLHQCLRLCGMGEPRCVWYEWHACLPPYWLVPGSDCHFTCEHGNI